MTEKHSYYYLHIDSKNRNDNENRADFRVNIPMALTNCSRVCLKSFSIENTFSNFVGNLTVLFWVEFYKSSDANLWIYKAFKIDFGENVSYIDNISLKDLLNTTFATAGKIFDIDNNQTHQFAAESAMDLNFDFSETDYKYKVRTNTANIHKLFSPCRILDKNIWTHMGFTNVLDIDGIDATLTYLNDKYQTTSTFNELKNDVYLKNRNIVDSYSQYTAVERTLQSNFASKLENHIKEIYVCSRELSTDTLRTNKENGISSTIGTHILENVVNDVPKFSYLHKEINFPSYHRLPQKNIQSFSIQILDHDFKEFDDETLPDFKLVLQFEQTLEIEYHKEMFEAYNTEGYKLGHQF